MKTAIPTSSIPEIKTQRLDLNTAVRVTEEDLPAGVMTEVREALKRDYFISERDEYETELKRRWSPPDSLRGSEMVHLYRCQETKRYSVSGQSRWSGLSLCNKATIFYWMQSATIKRGDADGLAILGSIWNTWVAASGRLPHSRLDDFFALPVSVGKKFATTIPELLQAHKDVCSQIQRMLDNKGTWPDRDSRYFRVHPLCEALIIVFDDYKYVESNRVKGADGFYHYDNVAQDQSILLVRTGREDGLRGPISFALLKYRALPLARNEDMGDIDIIRVPLQFGVRFVASLYLREEAAVPHSFVAGPDLSQEPDHPFMECEREAIVWGEDRIARAQARREISSTSTLADVKRAVLLNSRLDEESDNYTQLEFKHGWI